MLRINSTHIIVEAEKIKCECGDWTFAPHVLPIPILANIIPQPVIDVRNKIIQLSRFKGVRSAYIQSLDMMLAQFVEKPGVVEENFCNTGCRLFSWLNFGVGGGYGRLECREVVVPYFGLEIDGWFCVVTLLRFGRLLDGGCASNNRLLGGITKVGAYGDVSEDGTPGGD